MQTINTAFKRLGTDLLQQITICAWSLLLPPPQSWAACTQWQLSVALHEPDLWLSLLQRALTVSIWASLLPHHICIEAELSSLGHVDLDMSHNPRTDFPAFLQTCLPTRNWPRIPADPGFHHWTCSAHRAWVRRDWAAVGWPLP